MSRSIRYLLGFGMVALLASCGGPTVPDLPDERNDDEQTDPNNGGGSTSMVQPPSGVILDTTHLA